MTSPYVDGELMNAAKMYSRIEARLDTLDTQVAALQTLGEAGVSAVAVTSGTDTTTSASYANMTGTGSQTSFSFTKGNASTRVKLTMHVGSYVTVATSTVIRFGMQINSVDYDLATVSPEATSARRQASGFAYVPSGLAAGTYTVQARWKRTAGTGTPTRDTNDWLSISAEEVP